MKTFSILLLFLLSVYSCESFANTASISTYSIDTASSILSTGIKIILTLVLLASGVMVIFAAVSMDITRLLLGLSVGIMCFGIKPIIESTLLPHEIAQEATQEQPLAPKSSFETDTNLKDELFREYKPGDKLIYKGSEYTVNAITTGYIMTVNKYGEQKMLSIAEVQKEALK